MVDFYCPKAKLVIELDGGQHYSEAIQEKDESRDRLYGWDRANRSAILG